MVHRLLSLKQRSHEVSTTSRVAGGSHDCRLSIADFRLAASDKANWQSEIENRKSRDPPATREVVLTSWDRGMCVTHRLT